MPRETKTRDAHIFGPGPKRILALDGGGVLGVIEVAFVEKIEKLLRDRTGDENLVLSDYFDLIGGTSTGAIIATALALGMSAKEVKALYFDMAPAIFKRPLLSVPIYSPRFNARALANKLRGVLRDRDLGSDDLKTGLALCLKRLDTGSPWVLTNNSRAVYWDDPKADPETGEVPFIGNKRYLLRNLVRASTAAPFYFNPKKIQISDGDHGLFVDGGVSPHNNPSLQLLMLAGIKGYGFNWPIDENRLMMISVGSGWQRPRVSVSEGVGMASAELAVKALAGLIWDSQVNTLKVLQWLSKPRRPWPINSEVGSLELDFLAASMGGEMGDAAGVMNGAGNGAQALLNFQRYDLSFESDWLAEELEIEMSQKEASALNDFTNPKIMEPTYELASKAAERHVHGDDFPAAFNV